MEQLTSRDFFFCYSPHLASYIEKQGIRSITIAINPKNMNKFTMFSNSKDLSKAIEKYREQK